MTFEAHDSPRRAPFAPGRGPGADPAVAVLRAVRSRAIPPGSLREVCVAAPGSGSPSRTAPGPGPTAAPERRRPPRGPGPPDQDGRGRSPSRSSPRRARTAIAAILGTLQAGKVCVPLDPRYPPANRLGHIVADSRANLIATDSRNLGLARDLRGTGARLGRR